MDPFVAEIRIFGFNFAPTGWAQCNGQLLPISSNTALFSLLGTTYGGNGMSNFALPNLQGSASLHTGGTQGPGLTLRFLGELSGTAAISLITSEIPAHTHTISAKTVAGNNEFPTGNVWGVVGTRRPAINFYSTGVVTRPMGPQSLTIAGNSSPHNNLMPYVACNYCIAMQGVFPPRT